MGEDAERARLDVDRKFNPNVIAGMASAVTLDLGRAVEGQAFKAIQGSRNSSDRQARNARILAASRQPPTFKGEHPAAWIAQMELFMECLGMAEDEKLAVALTFLDEKATRWYTLALPRSERPSSWSEFKVRLMEHYAPFSAAEAIYRLRQVKQTGTIRDYIDRFNEVLADCSEMGDSESLQTFVEGLHAGIRRFVHMCQDLAILPCSTTERPVERPRQVAETITGPPASSRRGAGERAERQQRD